MAPVNELTEVVYAFIKTYHQQHLISPSIREIAAGCFISTGAVIRHLDRLEAAGRIQRNPNQARSIALLDEPEES